jgi:hypothetical protein
MQRLNFTLDDQTVALLDALAVRFYSGNKSLTVRAALESLAAHTKHDGWVISGYTMVMLDQQTACHTCGEAHQKGEVLYRPVFERGSGNKALTKLPQEVWLECSNCVENAAPV